MNIATLITFASARARRSLNTDRGELNRQTDRQIDRETDRVRTYQFKTRIRLRNTFYISVNGVSLECKLLCKIATFLNKLETQQVRRVIQYTKYYDTELDNYIYTYMFNIDR